MTQGELEKIPQQIVNAMNDLQMRIMEDMVRRIRINGFSTASADWQFTRLQQLGMSERQIKERVQECLEASDEVIDSIYSDDIYELYMEERRGYRVNGVRQIPFEENPELQQLIEAVKRQTSGELERITGSMGFVLTDPQGRQHPESLSSFYMKTLDNAVYDIHSGAFDYNTVLKRTIDAMTGSGVRWIDYDSGVHNRIAVAARRAVMTGFRQVQGKINEQTARDLHTDSYEVTVHIGARPTHQPWEGKVWTMAQLRSVCGLGTVTGLHGANCYHDYSPFIPGVSVRTYSDEQLDQIHEDENTPKTYNGREYTTYEALQRQRQLETRARKYREDVHLLEEGGGSEDDIIAKKCRYQKTMQEYRAFSNKMDLPMQKERIYQDGLKVDMKAPKSAKEASDQAVKKKDVLERSRLIKTETDLRNVSKSGIINLKSSEEISTYFRKIHGILVEGFNNKELLAIQSPLAGYDDMLSEFPVLKGSVREIHYNSRLSSNGDIDLVTGKSRVGKSGLFDYGTGIHESAHMLDYIRSKAQGCDYAAKIVEQARKNLGLRTGTKPYKNQVYKIVGLVKDREAYKDPKEIFAFAIETAKGNIDNPLAMEIYRLVKEE